MDTACGAGGEARSADGEPGGRGCHRCCYPQRGGVCSQGTKPQEDKGEQVLPRRGAWQCQPRSHTVRHLQFLRGAAVQRKDGMGRGADVDSDGVPDRPDCQYHGHGFCTHHLGHHLGLQTQRQGGHRGIQADRCVPVDHPSTGQHHNYRHHLYRRAERTGSSHRLRIPCHGR